MKRRSFLKYLGAATVATVVAPSVLIEETKKPDKFVGYKGIWHQLKDSNVYNYGDFSRDDVERFVESTFNTSLDERRIRFISDRFNYEG